MITAKAFFVASTNSESESASLILSDEADAESDVEVATLPAIVGTWAGACEGVSEADNAVGGRRITSVDDLILSDRV